MAAARERAGRDRETRVALITRTWNYLLQADVERAKIALREYVFANTGIAAFARGAKISPRRLARALEPGAGPHVKELCGVLGYIRTKEGLEFTVRIKRGGTMP